jgi:tRNA1Val (adenine37-N6)-methyltransferase
MCGPVMRGVRRAVQHVGSFSLVRLWTLVTRDSLFSGNLLIYQEEKGYRFSIDAVLLAGMAGVKPGDRVVELGSGCGVVLLILGYRGQARSLLGIEIQEELHALAQRNARENGLDGFLRFQRADWRDISRILPPRSCDLVISNPPYRRLHSGKVNPISQRAIARHEIAATLPDLFKAAAHLLPDGGRMGVIYPSTRLGSLMVEAHEAGFRPRELTVIFSYPGGMARLVFGQFTKRGGEELRISPPFFIYERPSGEYSEAMKRLYEA